MEELTFLDLAVLQRIDSESVVEKFGQKINSSFFDAANILGGLKLKGYINIESSLGFSPIKITEAGKEVLRLADEKNDGVVGPLDAAILNTVGAGKKDAGRLATELNVRPSDLAFHLYKLAKMGLVDYTVRNGRVELVLTEQGFNKTGLAEAHAKALREVAERGEKSEAEFLVGEERVEAKAPATPAGQKPAGLEQKPHAPAVERPVAITPFMRMQARLEWYAQKYLLYVIAALVLVAIILIVFIAKTSAGV
ncbi:MAG: hypothetical protein QXH27_06065 [Candidatus Micrarchaeia archaeon]